MACATRGTSPRYRFARTETPPAQAPTAAFANRNQESRGQPPQPLQIVQRERYVAADGDARTHTEAGGLVAISVEAGPVTVENLLHARLRDVHEQRRRERLRRVRDASHSQAT